MAKRIQRKRTKGWKMPANAVYVGRPTLFGNPWRVSHRKFSGRPLAHTCTSAAQAVAAFRGYVLASPRLMILARSLRGKDLACWCPLDQPCHADVLLEIANAE